MNAPLVSIVLPVHNGEQYLRQSVESCLQQTYEELELIVVDDASDDSTPEIVASYKDPRIRYFRNRTNLGLPESLNRGFAEAKGELLTWTSDDNYYGPGAIEALARELMSDPRNGLVYGSFHLVDEQNRILTRKACPPPVYLPRLDAVGAYFLYRKEVHDVVGDYDPDVRLAEDYDYWLRVYRRFRMRLIDADQYYYRVHSASLSGTSSSDRLREVTRRVQRKNNTLGMQLNCSLYILLDPVAAAISRNRMGQVVRPMFSKFWRGLGGR